MDERLLAAYLATAYQVRLPSGGRATIRIGEALPPALASLAGTRPWGFITAWNPASTPRPRAWNRQAQRALLAALRELPALALIRAGAGRGDHWRESSLFVIGVDTAALDTLARRHGQHAYLHGEAGGRALLRRMDKPAELCGQSPG
ncbi:DUF3293 domain-containing protein [Dyella sp. 2RAB6]|uniref:DUF3293 domain-containing protein n=1 Tax=Dyella sp. 2RAB6 TaxID=3232992 RepID=UPI003F911CA7